jgi:hypothetical protein
VGAWLNDAAHQLSAEYPAARVEAGVYETEAFAVRAYLAITRGDPAIATDEVVVSVDVKRDEDVFDRRRGAWEWRSAPSLRGAATRG